MKNFCNFTRLRSTLSAFAVDGRGATAIEYGIIAAGISDAIIGSVSFAGTQVSQIYGVIASSMQAAG
jgi:pilus assembly protein Flp/PilA